MTVKSFSIIDIRTSRAVLTIDVQEKSYSIPHDTIRDMITPRIYIDIIDRDAFAGRATILLPTNPNEDFEIFAKALRYFYENELSHLHFKLINSRPS